MHFLFMDESFGDTKRHAEPVVLTGILVSAADHAPIRTGYLELLLAASPGEEGIVEQQSEIHAVSLFKSSNGNDAQRFQFFNGIVDLVLRYKIEAYRVGYYYTPELASVFRTKKNLLSLCLLEILSSVTKVHGSEQIWPVMETDRSDVQDLHFPAMVGSLSYYGARVGKESISIDYTNLGELLYSTKHSKIGSIVDCVAYLRRATEQQAVGGASEFKQRLAEIGRRLDPSMTLDCVQYLRISKG
jgi:hypothetical protein